MTRRNFKQHFIENKTGYILLSMMMTAMFGMIGMHNADAALCPWDSQRSIYRCYAVHPFYPDSPLYSNGVKSTNKVLDHTINNQFVLSSTWAITPVNGKFFETAWKDNQYSTSHPFFTCGVQGLPVGSWGTPTNGTYYNFRTHDSNKDQIWKMEVDGTTAPSTCQGNAGETKAWILKTGYETPYDTNYIEKNDYKTLQFVRDNVWYFWQDFYGSNGAPVEIPFGAFFAKYCGTGDEQFYHSQHGKGSAPPSCT